MAILYDLTHQIKKKYYELKMTFEHVNLKHADLNADTR